MPVNACAPAAPPPHDAWRILRHAVSAWPAAACAMPTAQQEKVPVRLPRGTSPDRLSPSCTTRESRACPDEQYMRRCACTVCSVSDSDTDSRPQECLPAEGHAAREFPGRSPEGYSWSSCSRPTFSMNALMSSARQTVVQGPSFTGLG